MADEQTRDEINRLYWGSDASVGDIADRVGVSRRALYDSIEPKPASVPCPDCGGVLGFRNRTAAESREATCADCGIEQDLPPADAGEPEPVFEPGGPAAGPSPGRTRRVPDVAPALGGILLAGLAVGAAVGWAIRRS